MEKSEDNLIAWIRDRLGAPAPDVLIGIGDDMAMVRPGAEDILLTSDMLADGVDFDTRRHTPEQIGRKALAATLSDCAAMAARPRYALVSVSLPDTWSMEQARGVLLGMQPLAEKHDVRIVGGDTNSWAGPLVIDVMIVATPWPDCPPVRRSGMKPFDLVIVTGELGGSLAGRHMDFAPRIDEAHWIRRTLGDGLHAMMDISDGISTDARRMADASGCAIMFSQPLLESVASRAAQAASTADGRSLLDHVLNDGEDFELLLAVDAEAWGRLMESRDGDAVADPGRTPRWRSIGSAELGKGLWLERVDGSHVEIEPRGWQHFVKT